MIRQIILVGLLHCELDAAGVPFEDIEYELDARAPLGLRFEVIARMGPRVYVRTYL